MVGSERAGLTENPWVRAVWPRFINKKKERKNQNEYSIVNDINIFYLLSKYSLVK